MVLDADLPALGGAQVADGEGADAVVVPAVREAAGVDAPYMCRGGACGTCALEVLEGTPEHRDFFQSAAERATNCNVLPCVSRARGGRIVLNI